MKKTVSALLMASLMGCGSGSSVAPQDGGLSDGGTTDSGTTDGGTTDGGTAGGPEDAGTSFLTLRHSPIIDENLLPGSTGWRLLRASSQIAAYCDRTSYLAGQRANVSVAASSATTTTWQLWRVGYYGGAGGRQLAQGGPVSVPAFTAGTLDPTTGAVSAGWSPNLQIEIPTSAMTGVYLVRLTSSLGETYATFVVREPAPAATILYPVSTDTYQAYNPWGGTSLYMNSRSDWTAHHAYAVSFDRPYVRGNGSGELLAKDLDFITFAEGQGYDLAYVTDSDLDATPDLIDRRRMVVIQGHSEYWTANMRDALDRAVSRGSNAAFFAANDAYWQVRFQDATRRLLIGYKDFAKLDPAMQTDPAHVTTKWRNAPVNRPENALIGEMYGTWMTTEVPLTVTDPSSWLWTGSGMSANGQIAGVYGTECDRRIDNGYSPANVQLAGQALAEDYNGALFSTCESTLYTAPSGAIVFSAGSISWSRQLSAPDAWDPRIQQLTANIFSRFAGDGTLGPAALQHLDLSPGATTPTYRGNVTVSTWTRALSRPAAIAVAPNGDAIVADADAIVRVTSSGRVSVIAGGAPGNANGSVATAQFRNPHGVAVAPNGDIYVSDTGNHLIRKISGGAVTTLAGSGQQTFADGPAAQAAFNWPMGIALRADGTLLVADMWNLRLRAVSPTGDVSTLAGNGASDPVDGPGSSAHLSYPFAVALLANGDAAIAEPATGVVRTVSMTAGHNVSQLLGAIGRKGWTDGPASSASVSETLALAGLPDGQLVMLDGASSRVRTLRPNGTVETLAGGTRGGTIDGPGESAGFGWPRGVAVVSASTVLVVDAFEHSVRQLTLGQ